MKKLILLLLKAPHEGFVKSRLAADVGEANALGVYKALVQAQLSRLPANWDLQIHFTPSDSLHLMRDWLGMNLTYTAQCDGDLGDRLAFGFYQGFEQDYELVCAIGGDCPLLSAKHFEDTCRHLEQNPKDLVIGPSEDGGYYLIAMREFIPELFEGIPWSSQKTLSKTIQQAEGVKRRVFLLETLFDVDTIDDLRREDQPLESFL